MRNTFRAFGNWMVENLEIERGREQAVNQAQGFFFNPKIMYKANTSLTDSVP